MNVALRVIPAAALVVAGATLIAQQSNQTQPEIPLPDGWTTEDMQACMIAGTPGEQHAHLIEGSGTWRGTSTMWMAPGADPMESESTTTVTPILDGHYVRVAMEGEMPGWGMHKAEGVFGYDNISGEYVSTWIDNFSTGIMNGVGEASDDGKTITWTYTHNCPINKKPTTIREIDKITGPDSRTLTVYGNDPKTGEEFKMMYIELERVKGRAGHGG